MPRDDETYMFAHVSGDREFLDFIHERMRCVYKENELLDYMWTLREFRDNINTVSRQAIAWQKLPRFIRWWFTL